nr:homeobox protein 2-like [Maniola hyperantus]
MADSEDHDLRDQNNEMVKAMQHWKMTAAQKENEKLELMKEVNELRLKLSRLRNAESAHARKLNKELQSASEEALSHLVKASSVVARMLELAKSYMQGRQELEYALPRWSSLSNTPTTEKINRVPPLLIGGRHIQPVVSLSRTLQPNNSPTMSNRNPNQNNRSVSARAVPMHMLQDVFIPLTRIDAELAITNGEVNAEEANESTDDLASDGSGERLDEPTSGRDDSEQSQRLETVEEEMESEEETSRSPIDPLEGPSWLLDVPAHNTEGPVSVTVACEFTPTVRRRRRASPPRAASPRVALSPLFSPRPARRKSTCAPILKVMVTKMRLSDDEDSSNDASPPKRPNLDQITPKRPSRNEQKPNHTEIPPKRETRNGQPEPCCSVVSRERTLSRANSREKQPNHSNHTHSNHDNHNNPTNSNHTDENENRRAKNRENHPNHTGDHSKNNHDDHPSTSRENHSNHGNRRAKIRENNSNHTGDHSKSNHVNSSDNNQANSHDNHTSQNNSSNGNHSSYDHNNYTSNMTNTNRDTCSYVSDSRNSSSLRRRLNSHNDNGSDSSNSDAVSEGRTRRPRKAVVYKEKPLNRYL